MNDLKFAQVTVDINDIFQDATVPKIYMNGFSFAQSASDMFLAMNQGPKTVGVVYMSFTTAKTLAIALQETVAKFERTTGQPLLTMAEVQEKTSREPEKL